MILQNFTTALITLVIVSLAFFALEEQYFAHYHAPAGTVTQTIPVLTPLLPLGLPHSVVQKQVMPQCLSLFSLRHASGHQLTPTRICLADSLCSW